MKKIILSSLLALSGITAQAGDSSIYLCSKYKATEVGGQGSTYAAYVVDSRSSDGVSRDLTVTLVDAKGVLKGKVIKATEVELSSKTNSIAYVGTANMINASGKQIIEANIQLNMKAGMPTILSIRDGALDEEDSGLRIVLDECKELKN